MAQQMQGSTDETSLQPQEEYMLRKWNPLRIDASLGSDNSGSSEPMCPVFCLGWYILERLFFYSEFDGCIDYACNGKKSIEEILAEYRSNTNITGRVVFWRLFLFVIDVSAAYLIM